jgi:dipeptide/tripeptide permease
MLSSRLKKILISITVILTIPVLGKLFTDDFQWALPDFIIGAILLYGTSFMIDVIMRKVQKKSHKIALNGLILLVLLCIWAELAVGLIGTPFAGN